MARDISKPGGEAIVSSILSLNVRANREWDGAHLPARGFVYLDKDR